MPRYFVRLSYKGTRYAGWQVQDNATSVQQVLNNAISTILREEIVTTGCGRTDSGVHATMFYAHFDCLGLQDTIDKVIIGINAILPDDIAVYDLIPVDDKAHARFDAVSRSYEYFIAGHHDPFLKEYSMLCYRLPDLNKMNEGCSFLKGIHDFSSFCKSESSALTFECEIYEAFWIERKGVLVFNITANRFLRGMVRAVVGTMLEVGNGKASPSHIHEVLMLKRRSAAGTAAPAKGLFLTNVKYPYLPTPNQMQFPV